MRFMNVSILGLAQFVVFNCHSAFQFATGSIAIIYDDDDLKLGIVGWKGKLTVRAYVPRNERCDQPQF